MLPEAAGFVPVQSGNRIACSFAVQFPRPLSRFRKRAVAEDQQIPRGGKIIEEIEGQAIGFRIPEGMPAVSFPGEPLGSDVVSGVEAVVGLLQVIDAEANALLVFRIALDFNIRSLPKILRIGPRVFQSYRETGALLKIRDSR